MFDYIAFDPGKSGAIAVHTQAFGLHAQVVPVSGKELDIVDISKFILCQLDPKNTIAIVEKVHSRPLDGVVQAFSFGKSYGIVLGLLGGYGIRTELVTPQAWKQVVLAGTAKDKDAAIAYCRRAFPQISLLPTPRCRKPHDGIADALCLLEYGKRTFI
jgi:crossover junction endodeoxyribonuclease RuvC